MKFSNSASTSQFRGWLLNKEESENGKMVFKGRDTHSFKNVDIFSQDVAFQELM